MVALGLAVEQAFSSFSELFFIECLGFSLQWFLFLWSTGSRLRGFRSCAQILAAALTSTPTGPEMWNLPEPGIERVSPALEGRFLSTVPMGKSLKTSATRWVAVFPTPNNSLWHQFCVLQPYSVLILCLEILLQAGGRLPGPKTGLLSNTRKWIVRGDTCADKARDFIGKGHPGGEQ